MKVLLLTPWQNAWIPYFRVEFEGRGDTFALAKGWNGVSEHDLVLHAWTGLTAPVPGAKNVMFMRRFELFDGGIGKVDWKQVDHLICVNTWIADRVREVFVKNGIKTPVSVIYNGTDLERWKFKVRGVGLKIGMACHVHPKKNLSLAAQILAELPEEYELHIAGEIQDSCTAEYLNHIGKATRRKIYLYGQIPSDQLNFWWEQMNYCLSTSISEGNPNNVIEAMAKGIKPIIHDWPGSEDQFPSNMRFSTAQKAVKMIVLDRYESILYRDHVKDKFGLGNYTVIADLCKSLLEKEVA